MTRASDSRQEKGDPAWAEVAGQAPPAKPLTLVLFYLLAAVTLGMAAWALISIMG